MAEAFRIDSVGVDLSNRIQSYQTVDASPALAAETIIATLTLSNFASMQLAKGVQLAGWAAFTVGTSGTAANLRIRQTNVTGAVKAATGATSVTAANLVETGCQGFDAGAGVSVYVLTLIITAGAAASTVSACQLTATLI